MNRAILSEILITLTTTASRRNLAAMNVATPLDQYDQFVSLSETLKKNNSLGNDAQSLLTLPAVKEFIYIHSTGPVSVGLLKGTDLVQTVVTRFFITTSSFNSVTIENNSQADDVAVKVIYS